MAQDSSPRFFAVSAANNNKKVRDYSKGEKRVCDHEGCETILSKYNSEKQCGVHSLGHFVKNRAR